MTGGIGRFVIGSAAIAALLTLTACGSIAQPSPAESAPALAAPPVDRVQLGCDELLGAEERARATGYPDTVLTELQVPLYIGSVAMAQGGLLECRWDGLESAAAFIRVGVLPDATDSYQADSNHRKVGFTSGLVGPNSIARCLGGDGGRLCDVQFDSDGYWVVLEFEGRVAEKHDEAALTVDAAQIAATIRDALRAAGPPRPAFVPVADSVGEWSSCSDLDADGAFRHAVGAPSFITPEVYEGVPAMFSVAMKRGFYARCDWEHANLDETPAGEIHRVTVEMIQGGGWAWPELIGPTAGYEPKAEIDVPGADIAVIACSGEYDCVVQALVRGSYIEVTASNEVVNGNNSNLRTGAIRGMELAIAAL